MFDDGLHGDGAAGDGVYGGYWDVGTIASGTYYVRIEAEDGLGNRGITEEPGEEFNVPIAVGGVIESDNFVGKDAVTVFLATVLALSVTYVATRFSKHK